MASKQMQRTKAVDRGVITLSVNGEGVYELEPAQPVELRYDYETIDVAHRATVRIAAVEIKSALRRTQEDLIRIGQRLLEVKEVLPHGQFQDWLKAEFALSDRMARRFMNVAEVYGGKTDTVSVLSGSALMLLAAPSTPRAAREAVEQEAKATGNSPTKKRTEQIIDAYKEPTRSEPPAPGGPPPPPPVPVPTAQGTPAQPAGVPAELAALGWRIVQTSKGNYYGYHTVDQRSTATATEVQTVIDDIYRRQRNVTPPPTPPSAPPAGVPPRYHVREAIEHLKAEMDLSPADSAALLYMIEQLERMAAS
jgi:Protein of unknown function (DUF3102)